jgi:uncharacterized protein (TIGR03086 family)
MDTSTAYRLAMNDFADRLHAVKPDQWDLPTPCEQWNVRELVGHMVGENVWAPELFAGKTIAEVGDRFDGDLLGSDPVTAFDTSATAAVRAASAEGALDRIVHLSFGDFPGKEYADQLFADALIHGWDLARAIDADERLDPDLVAACAQWFAYREDGYRQAGAIGPRVDVPAGADPQTRLLAAFGRTP